MSKDDGINDMAKQNENNGSFATTVTVPLENSELPIKTKTTDDQTSNKNDTFHVPRMRPPLPKPQEIQVVDLSSDSEPEPEPQQKEKKPNQQTKSSPSTPKFVGLCFMNSSGGQVLLTPSQCVFPLTTQVLSGIPTQLSITPSYPYLQPFTPSTSRINYINKMTKMFRDRGESQKYMEFLGLLRVILHDQAQGRRQVLPSAMLTDLERSEINSRVAKLFENQPLMLQEFQEFVTASNLTASTEHQPTGRLYVHNALSYLDQVKYHLKGQPAEYNHFLDVMKDYKANLISSSSVMYYVSNLFAGYPELVQGFNLFLPPGYKIEQEVLDRVDRPGNRIPQHWNQDRTLQVNTSDSTGGRGVPVISIPDSEVPKYPEGALVIDEDPQLQENENLQRTPESFTNWLLPIHVDERLATNRNMDETVLARSPFIIDGFPVVHAKDPVEFGEAVGFLQKVKDRFQGEGQHEKYTKFVAILRRAQKRQRLAQAQQQSSEGRQEEDCEAYFQISKLLEHHEDLLKCFEFHLCVPAPASTNQQKPDHNLEHDTPNNPQLSPICTPCDVEGNGNLNVKKAKPPKKAVGFELRMTQNPGPRVQWRKTNRTVGPVPVPKPEALGAKRPGRPPGTKSPGRPPGTKGPGRPPGTKGPGRPPGTRRPGRPPGTKLPGRPPGTKRSGRPPGTKCPLTKEVRRMIADIRRQSTSDGRYKNKKGTTLFKKARQSTESKEADDIFMQCLGMYKNGVIDKSEFVKMVTSFGTEHHDLFERLDDFHEVKNIADDSVSSVGQVSNPEDEVDMGPQLREIDLSTCKKYGPCYYALPDYRPQAWCSGRTKLCKQVLNDTFISRANDSDDEYKSRIGSKDTHLGGTKEAKSLCLGRIEDERFELDRVIDSNFSTIEHFEKMVKKMNRMTTKQLHRFKLDDSLGGTSRTHHINAIRRLYGDRVGPIIDGIKSNPSGAVPIVLRRLKDKDEEWQDLKVILNMDWRQRTGGKTVTDEIALREVAKGTKRAHED